MMRFTGGITLMFKRSFLDSFKIYNKYIFNKFTYKKSKFLDQFELVEDSPSIYRQRIKTKLERLISKAKREIVIETPYFLPGHKIRKLLADAAKRGVNVKIILPMHSDVRSIDLLSSKYLGFYYSNKIKLVFYTLSNLHAKLLLIRISGRNSTGADLLVQNSWLTGRLLNHQPLIELATLPTLPGEHNAQNIAAAVAVGLQLGLSRDQLCAGLRSFPGLAHRQELIARPADIACINDSKATNAEATAKALACYDNILWIAGGRPKQEDMHELLPLLSRITHAFLIGEGASKFADFLQRRVDYSLCETLPHAVQQAFAMGKKLQESGQATPTILLSPACASFDQYQNFEQRGDHFRQLVITLQTKGQIAA
jgi:hypothetical protein